MKNIGQLNQRVKFFSTAPVEDTNGNLVGPREPLLETWAQVMPLKGSRALQAGQILSGKPYEIKIRYRLDVAITEDLELEWQGAKMAIHSAIPESGGKDWLIITAYEVK